VFLFGDEASKPSVVTGPPSTVGPTSVTLTGTVNPQGEAVGSCVFEYGTSSAYGSSVPCSPLPGSGTSPISVSASPDGLTAGTTYHYRIVAMNAHGAGEGSDATFTTEAATTGSTGNTSGNPSTTTTAANSTATTTTGSTATATGASTSAGDGASPGIASTSQAIEEVRLGCSGNQLILNDAFIQGGHVALSGSAAMSLVGKKVQILFNEGKQVASATVGANGEFTTTAPLPPARIREALTTRYTAKLGKLRSPHLKLTRRLQLEPPSASGTSVTLSGRIELPLTKPISPVTVEQQLECGKTTLVKTFTPASSGRFHVTLSVPASARAAIYRLKSEVAANASATKHGFTTYSLPLPVAIG
jgi:hypothetical protein